MSFDALEPPLAVASLLASILFLVGYGMVLWRVARGPTIFDRILSLGLAGSFCLCLIVVFAICFDQVVLLDAAFALALVSFLGTVAFARYLERGGDKLKSEDEE